MCVCVCVVCVCVCVCAYEFVVCVVLFPISQNPTRIISARYTASAIPPMARSMPRGQRTGPSGSGSRRSGRRTDCGPTTRTTGTWTPTRRIN